MLLAYRVYLDNDDSCPLMLPKSIFKTPDSVVDLTIMNHDLSTVLDSSIVLNTHLTRLRFEDAHLKQVPAQLEHLPNLKHL